MTWVWWASNLWYGCGRIGLWMLLGWRLRLRGGGGSKSVFQALFMEFGYLTVGKKIIAINNIKE